MKSPNLHRLSIRFPGYDYSQPGEYFITICTYKHKPIFGEIIDNEMVLNSHGEIVREEWERSAEIRKEIELGAYIIMPNHFHGIVHLYDNESTQPFSISVGADMPVIKIGLQVDY